jgi:DNA-binding NarL/FixJ family response regulator
LSARKLELTHIRKRVVLVSMPGLVQQATRSTLASCPEADLIAVASGALSATKVLSQVQPDLLLIDANLPAEETEALLGWVKEHCQSVQCAVMTVTSQQRDQALTWGADLAIHRAGLADQLPPALRHVPASRLPAMPSLETGESFQCVVI